MRFLSSVLLILAAVARATASDGIYCGARNCYDVLKVRESATQSEIINAYRKLARTWHPDKNQHRRAEAEKQFSAIAHAYDILRNEQSRREYDYALKHPEEFAYNRARYYYRQYYVKHMKMNPFVVLLVALIGWSAFDYYSRKMSYNQAIRVFQESPEYKLELKRLREAKLQEMEAKGEIKKKMNGKRTRKEIDAVQVDEQELIDRIQIHGSYRKPKWMDTAIIQFWLLPFYFTKAVIWQVKWIYRYNIKGEEYTDEDKEYIVRGILNISKGTWDAIEDRRKDKLMAKELWIPENEKAFRRQMAQAAIAARAGDEPDFSDD